MSLKKMTMNLSKTIAHNLQFLRQSHKYSRKQICTLLNISLAAWGCYTDARAKPKLETLISIADYFKITLDELARVDLSKCYVVIENKYMEKLIIEQLTNYQSNTNGRGRDLYGLLKRIKKANHKYKK